MYGTTGVDSAGFRSRRRASAQRIPLAQLEALQESGTLLQEQEPEAITWTIYLLAACSSLNSCNLGFDLGVNADAGPLLKTDLGLDDGQFEAFMTVLPICAAIGCACTAVISDSFGRRATFAASNVTLLLGTILVITTSSYGMLLVGRGFVGLGVGLGLSIDPVYIAELSPPSHRGWLVTWSEIAITLGCFLGTVCGWLLSSMPLSQAWRAMFAVGGAAPILMLILVATVMLESPRWLVLMGKDEEAISIIRQVFGEQADSHRIKKEISKSLLDEVKSHGTHSWTSVLWPTGSLKWMMLVGVLSAAAQQVVAIEPMTSYQQIILAAAGEKSMDALTWYPMLGAGAKCIAVVVAGRLFDNHGRRPMMLISFGGMAASFSILAALFLFDYTPMWLVVPIFILWMVFYGMGAGPGCWLLASELFSTSVRAKGMSVACVANRLVSALWCWGFLSLADIVGMGPVFALLAILSALYTWFFFAMLPETKGETLEEIADIFCGMDAHVSARHFRASFVALQSHDIGMLQSQPGKADSGNESGLSSERASTKDWNTLD